MMKENSMWDVCVRCSTYNHAPFIEKAMNGFTMQRTTFPFVCTIIDDASTDGEQDVIRQYLSDNFDLSDNSIARTEETDDYILSFARHKRNKQCYFAVLYLKYNHYKKKDREPYMSEWLDNSKYIAWCEGDDYWIDSLKLQKQYDILENDETVSMCHHNFYELFPNGEKKCKERGVPVRQDLLSVAKNNYTQTLCMFYRNLRPMIPDAIKGRIAYSQFYALRLAEIGDIYYINEPMAVYRRNPNSIFGMQPAIRKFEMMTASLDTTIYWYNLSKRADVEEILKKRGRKSCIRYLLHFLRRLNLKNSYRVIKKYIEYI